jgi:hypothetical protein
VTAADLADAHLVVALPVHDYPSPLGDTSSYDEAWTDAELDIIEAYVRDGGLLVVTNSAHRLKYYNLVYEDNEDLLDQNALAERFGVSFFGFPTAAETAQATGGHPLVRGVTTLDLAQGNACLYSARDGEVIARMGGSAAITVKAAGAGEVIVLADLGILGNRGGDPANLEFWRNLARYAR